MDLQKYIDIAAEATEAAGIGLILGGMALASVRSLIATTAGARFQRYRQDLGRAILLGLEVLIAADIIRTVTLTLTMGSLSALGMIVLIRTFLSWSLALELEGRWPWQRATDVVEPSQRRTP